MNSKKRILVIGATGAQGGSVARHLLNDKTFTVRIITRNIHSPKAIALQAAGAEVMYGDLENKNSLTEALQNVQGVFGVTNYWEHFDKEYQLGKNLIDAVVRSQVDHFVFSSLPSATTISNGAIKVPHFDIKAALQIYARRLKPGTTFVHVAAYYENFAHYYAPQKGFDGTFYFGFPQGTTNYAAVSVEDIGGAIINLFKNPAEYKGKTIGITGEDRPPAFYARMMSEVFNKAISYNHIARKEYAAFDMIGANELASMFEFNRLYVPQRQADVTSSRMLYPGMRTFRDWLQDNKHQFYFPASESWLLTGS